jgi:uncharacterized protein YcbK (DUF882 family)
MLLEKTETKNKMGDLTKNFSKSEFDCNSACEMPSNVFENVQVHAYNLQDFFDAPVIINSAYRCPEYNAKVGGASKSQH